MAEIVVHKRAAKYLERMDARIKAQVLAKMEALAKNPDAVPNVKPMEGDLSLGQECGYDRHFNNRATR